MTRRVDYAKIRRAKASKRVLDRLERRWQEDIPGGELHASVRREIRKTPAFSRLVDQFLRDQTLALPDVTLVSRIDEGGRDLLVNELGLDPADFHCDECEEPVPRGQGLCSDCAKWASDMGVET